MRILDSTLTCSNLAVETQSHQLLLSGIKHLNYKCVAVLLTLRNILLTAVTIPVNSNRTVFNSTLQHFIQFSSFWKWSYPIFLWKVTLSQIHATNMSKLTIKNTNKDLKKPNTFEFTINFEHTYTLLMCYIHINTLFNKEVWWNYTDYGLRVPLKIENFRNNILLVLSVGIRLKWRKDNVSFQLKNCFWMKLFANSIRYNSISYNSVCLHFSPKSLLKKKLLFLFNMTSQLEIWSMWLCWNH